MRVISGRYRGRQLVSFKASHIRPTTDQIKEIIFNKLQAQIQDCRLLDLYAGTGSLSIEALSRGASRVVAVESNRKSLQIMKKNRDLLKISDEWQVVPQDVFRFLKTATETFDIVIIDPPFTKKLAHDTMLAIAESNVLTAGAEVYIESSAQEPIEDHYGDSLELKSRKSFGDKYLSHYVFG